MATRLERNVEALGRRSGKVFRSGGFVVRATRKGRRPRRARAFFIAGAIGKPGALRAYVLKTFGKEGFTGRGTIKESVVNQIASGQCPVCVEKVCVCPTSTIRKRAVLARTLARLRK